MAKAETAGESAGGARDLEYWRKLVRATVRVPTSSDANEIAAECARRDAAGEPGVNTWHEAARFYMALPLCNCVPCVCGRRAGRYSRAQRALQSAQAAVHTLAEAMASAAAGNHRDADAHFETAGDHLTASLIAIEVPHLRAAGD